VEEEACREPSAATFILIESRRKRLCGWAVKIPKNQRHANTELVRIKGAVRMHQKLPDLLPSIPIAGARLFTTQTEDKGERQI
jgi:hypothetical protein